MSVRALCLIVLCACASAPAPRRVSLDALARAKALRRTAEEAGGAKRYDEAARLSVEAAAVPGDPQADEDHYTAACYLALAGRPARALDELGRAVDTGWDDAEWTDKDPDLASLRGDPRYGVIVARARAARAAIVERQREPQNARLVTEDIERFWRAYDLAAAAGSRDERVAIFRREYIERATPGLLDYYTAKIQSVEQLADYVADHRRFYDAVRPQTLRIVAGVAGLRDTFARMKALHAEARFPDVTFVIGRLSSGGTSTSHGLIIGAEMYSTTEATPLDELSFGARRVVSRAGDLPHIVAHELVHFQQVSSSPAQTLLRVALLEGGAEFFAELVEPAPQKPFYRTFGEAHQAEVWAEFARELDGKETARWIGGNLTATAERPADLGYFIGYEIARRYYERAGAGPAAVRALLTLDDPHAILQASGFGAP